MKNEVNEGILVVGSVNTEGVSVLQRVHISVYWHEQQGGSDKPDLSHKVQSHSRTIGGPGMINASVRKKQSSIIDPKHLNPSEFYEHMCTYILTLEQLISNGFPQALEGEKGKAKIEFPENRAPKASSKSNERICVRCGKTFMVDSEGLYVNTEECTYHWGKSWKRKVNGAFDSRYTCCQSDAGSAGCQVCSVSCVLNSF